MYTASTSTSGNQFHCDKMSIDLRKNRVNSVKNASFTCYRKFPTSDF